MTGATATKTGKSAAVRAIVNIHPGLSMKSVTPPSKEDPI